MSKPVIFLDGKYVPVPAAVLAAFAPGNAPGQGVFETVRAVDGAIELLDEHISRLLRGLRVLKITSPHTARQLKDIARRVVRRNAGITLGRLRILVFKHDRIHCAVMVEPYRPPTASQYRRGLKAVFVRTQRPAHARRAQVKSLDYGLFASSYRYALAQGYEEALLVNARGYVFEASRANVFIVHKGRLTTPPLSSGCLDGIMRRQVMTIAKGLNISVDEKNLTPAMVRAAEKIFLTNSMMGIIPCRV